MTAYTDELAIADILFSEPACYRGLATRLDAPSISRIDSLGQFSGTVRDHSTSRRIIGYSGSVVDPRANPRYHLSMIVSGIHSSGLSLRSQFLRRECQKLTGRLSTRGAVSALLEMSEATASVCRYKSKEE